MQRQLLENIIQYTDAPASDLLDQIIEQTVSHKKRNRISEIINFYPSDKDVIPEHWCPPTMENIKRNIEQMQRWRQELQGQFYPNRESRYVRTKYARPVSLPKMTMWTPDDVITWQDTIKVEYVDVWMDRYTGEIVPEAQVLEEQRQAAMSRNNRAIACQPGCKCICGDCNVGDCWRCECNVNLRVRL